MRRWWPLLVVLAAIVAVSGTLVATRLSDQSRLDRRLGAAREREHRLEAEAERAQQQQVASQETARAYDGLRNAQGLVAVSSLNDLVEQSACADPSATPKALAADAVEKLSPLFPALGEIPDPLLILDPAALTRTSCERPVTTVPAPTPTAPPTSAPPTTAVPVQRPAPGGACDLGSFSDCIDPDGDGSGVYLTGGAQCVADFRDDVGLCSDLDGDGRAGYPDSN